MQEIHIQSDDDLFFINFIIIFSSGKAKRMPFGLDVGYSELWVHLPTVLWWHSGGFCWCMAALFWL